MQKVHSLDKLRILSGSSLKLIAVITMLIDHSAFLFTQEFGLVTVPFVSNATIYYIMRKIGRLAFPIFCFLISEGFAHTRNKRNYTLRLLLFALISEIPFNLRISGKLFHMAYQNVYFTLFLGSLMLYIYEHMADGVKKTALMLAVIAAALLIRADYGMSGVIVILVIYLFRNHRTVQAIAAFPMLSGGLAAFAAFIPINMYNGKRGFIQSPVLKYLFYFFYPLHILILVLIKHLLKTA